jgi:hypothetical protein
VPGWPRSWTPAERRTAKGPDSRCAVASPRAADDGCRPHCADGTPVRMLSRARPHAAHIESFRMLDAPLDHPYMTGRQCRQRPPVLTGGKNDVHARRVNGSTRSRSACETASFGGSDQPNAARRTGKTARPLLLLMYKKTCGNDFRKKISRPGTAITREPLMQPSYEGGRLPAPLARHPHQTSTATIRPTRAHPSRGSHR